MRFYYKYSETYIKFDVKFILQKVVDIPAFTKPSIKWRNIRWPSKVKQVAQSHDHQQICVEPNLGVCLADNWVKNKFIQFHIILSVRIVQEFEHFLKIKPSTSNQTFQKFSWKFFILKGKGTAMEGRYS